MPRNGNEGTMLIYTQDLKEIVSSSGGYKREGLQIRDIYVKLGRNQKGILYEPVVRGKKSSTAVVIIHSDDDYSTKPMGAEMARRGYLAFCGQVGNHSAGLDDKIREVKNVMDFLHCYPGVENVVLMGHSGGATLMTAYQAAAENGAEIFRGREMLIPCSVDEALPPADGIMLLDSNWGNGAMTLFSIDPAVTEENSGTKLNPELDIFDPANGYDPAGSHYPAAFLKKYFTAQRERNNKLIEMAVERLHVIESGKGYFIDDEPFIVAGGAQIAPCNKLFPEDIHLLAHTKGAYPLLHGDGTVTTETVVSLRRPRGTKTSTPYFNRSALVTTVKNFLSERAVPAGDDYCVKEDGVCGIQWDCCYDCPPANVRHIRVPLLSMGMTGSYEYLAAEEIYNNAGSRDKEIAFVEGAGHNFTPEISCESYPGQFGDTQKILYDYVAEWLSKPGRFQEKR